MAVGGGMVVVVVGGVYGDCGGILTEMPSRKFIIYIVLTVDLTPVTKVTDDVKLE